MTRKLACLLFGIGLFGVAAVTLSPLAFRPVTGFPPQAERFAAFLCLGLLAVASAPRHRGLASLGLLVVAAVLEVLQTLAPGRHGRIFDFEVKAAGALAGAALAAVGEVLLLAFRKG